MSQEKHSDTNSPESTLDDITLNSEWVLQNADRLLAWELLRRSLFNRTEEVPAEKLCDMIGMPYTYIFSIIKKARKYAK
jgi:hypothetical protein